MFSNSTLFHLWKRQLFLRKPQDALSQILENYLWSNGIYLIGCVDRVVYIGQSNQLSQRSIDSLGRIYCKTPDRSLPWSIAFAPCAYEDMDELESAAIRAYAPEFNTSIPSRKKSLGRMPIIENIEQVFADQSVPSRAFSLQCVKRQIEEAAKMTAPPWMKGKTLSKDEIGTIVEQKFELRDLNRAGRASFSAISSQRRRAQRRRAAPTQSPIKSKSYINHKDIEIQVNSVASNEADVRNLSFEWTARNCDGWLIDSGAESDKVTAINKATDAAEAYLAKPHRFKINLCDDGSVVTRDGEYLGIWEADENDHPSFIPDGEKEVLFFEVWVGLLCQKIADWHEAKEQTPIS